MNEKSNQIKGIVKEPNEKNVSMAPSEWLSLLIQYTSHLDESFKRSQSAHTNWKHRWYHYIKQLRYSQLEFIEIYDF